MPLTHAKRTVARVIAAKPFNFSLHETLTVQEDTSSPANEQAARTKIYKLLKYSVRHSIAGDLLQNSALTAKSKDSLEILLRKKATARLKRTIRRVLQSPMGIDNVIGAMYCEALTTCYDPHTDYFPPDEKTAFESELGNKPLSFGLTLIEDENGKSDVDAYNKAVKDMNSSINAFNQTNNKVNNGRTQTVNEWASAEKDFADQHMPHYK